MYLRAIPLLLCAAALPAQHSESSITNPFRSPDDRARGGAFYRSQCANCHGIDGKGGASGPSLASGSFRHASTDEGLFRVITRGVPGTSMPGFSMNGREIWQIVAYIRSLSAARAAGAADGDPAAGRQVFDSAGCIKCHWLNGQGAPRGLDLTAIGARLAPAELHSALTDPNAEVAPQYWAWQAVTNDGQTLRGARLNEETFSKANLKSQSLEKRSSMPSYRETLTDRQRTDLVAFLSTLQGARN
jgi:cytochrome c oxidase cbb3-type subunit III